MVRKDKSVANTGDSGTGYRLAPVTRFVFAFDITVSYRSDLPQVGLITSSYIDGFKWVRDNALHVAMKGTQYKGAVIIPTDPDGSEHYINQVARNMAERFGGYSRYEGEGGWVDGDGNLIEEEHVRLEAVGDVTADFTGEFFRKQARFVRDGLGEECVMVEIQETDMKLV